MNEVQLTDRSSDFLGGSTRQTLENGFLKVKGRVARSGIQSYYRCELGLKDEPFKKIRLYRPPEVVLSDEVCNMFDGVDVTNEHPKQFIDKTNYRKLTAGVVLGSAQKDEENPNFIVCDMLIKDADTIKAIEAGKIQLSVGYRNTIDFTDGVTPDGEKYDARVDKITLVNHVALVPRARAGIEARLFDSFGGKMKNLKIGDAEFELNDEVASAIESHLSELEARAKTAEEAVTMKDGEIGELTAKVSELEKSLEETKAMILTDEDIKEVVKQTASLMDDARKVAGESFVCDSFDPLEIKKAAIKAAYPDVELGDKEEGFVNGFFAHAVSTAGVGMNDSQKKVCDALSKKKDDEEDKGKSDAYEKHMQDIANAWKK